MNTDMPAEVDFSDSIPNPYIGKVRRRVTMNTDMNNENRKVVTDEMIAGWESALERDEWPSGWVNVGEIVERDFMKKVEDFRAGRLETVTLDELEENLELTEDDTQRDEF